jgi:hypothetical protein
MTSFWAKFSLINTTAALLIATAHAQVTCSLFSALPSVVRAEGNTELLADIVLGCTGGTPTPAGIAVPQVNVSVSLTTNITSKITASSASENFSEALILVDEPNRPVSLVVGPPTSHPLLNCGQAGAPDNGPSGPAVCGIISTGNPAQTYDGTVSAGPNNICYPKVTISLVPSNVYGCGRPNAYQGRMAGSNQIQFLGMPFDPPGSLTRLFRFTNLRANMALLGGLPGPISATFSISGSSAITFSGGASSLTVPIAFPINGITAKEQSAGVLRVTEGFTLSWKARNVAFTLDNAMYSAGQYLYVPPDTTYPAQVAQNVPGIIYNAEDGFQWQNNAANKPPSPNPPAGYGSNGGLSSNVNYPLLSLGYSGLNTGINADGSSSAGTRIAITMKTTSPSVMLPSVVYLHPIVSPATTSGVMVLIKTDAAGAGAYEPLLTNTFHSGETAVYEVLYADPFDMEYADINLGAAEAVNVRVNLAPFYTSASAGVATPTPANPTPIAVPRFSTADGITVLIPVGPKK